ncbi:MAG: MBG domain-containing protein, partial [Chloroflexota bacterium]|nr:MBG domain-containing protein [Chloroflexota bacterium]
MTSGTGTCTVKYDQAGNSNYNAATQVTESVTAQKANQTITFDPLSDKTYGDPNFSVGATANSGLAVSFGSQTLSTCTVSGSTVHIVAAGTCTIRASQSGDSNYNAATNVDQSFNIAKANATVSLSNLSHTYDGTPKSATATTTPPGLSVDITYDGSATAPTDAGDYAVVATINDANYQGSANGTLHIGKANADCSSILGGTFPYDNNAHGASGTCSGIGGESAGTLDLGDSFTDVDGGTAHWTFTGNGNYNDDEGDVEIVITPVDATCVISGGTFPYDAAPHGATGICTGIGGEDAGDLNLGDSFTDV